MRRTRAARGVRYVMLHSDDFLEMAMTRYAELIWELVLNRRTGAGSDLRGAERTRSGTLGVWLLSRPATFGFA